MGEIRQPTYRAKDGTTKTSAVWWIRYYRDGRRYEESSKSKKKGDAIDLLRLREGDISKGLPVTPKIAKLTFKDATDDVVNDYKVNGKRSIDGVERRLRLHLLPYFGATRKMTGITTADLRAFIAKRQQPTKHDDGTETPGATNAEINREMAIIKRAS